MKRLAFLLLVVASISYAQGTTGLLPDSVGEYAKSDSARIYTGDGLYNLIDGGADIFREYGFDRVAVQRYSDTRDNYVDVELYEMKDSSSAYGIFSLITSSTGKRVAGFSFDAYSGDGFLLLWKGKYYASLTASGPSDDSVIVRAAVEMTRRIPESGRPPLVTIFDRMRFTGSNDLKVAYIKGGLGLYNVSRISFGGNLNFRAGVCLFTNGIRSIVLAFNSDDDCSRNYSLLVSHMKNAGEWILVQSAQDSGLYEGNGKYLKLVRIGDLVLLSTGEDDAALEKVLRRIHTILKGN